MSYTNSSGQPQGEAKRMTNKLREIMIAELMATSTYESHILNSNMPDINEMWHHIMEEEKEHYAMMLNLLRKYDPGEYEAYKNNSHGDEPPMSPMQHYKPNYDLQIILNNVRDDIKGELEAIILYEPMLAFASYPDVKQAIQKIIFDEKEHVEHLTKILAKYDPMGYKGLF